MTDDEFRRGISTGVVTAAHPVAPRANRSGGLVDGAYYWLGGGEGAEVVRYQAGIPEREGPRLWRIASEQSIEYLGWDLRRCR